MRFVFALLIILFSFVPHAKANDAPDLSAFSAWPVLHDGRVKTTNSFARSVFYTIAQDDNVDGLDALEWLAITLFDPSTAVNLPVVFIRDISVLDLPDRDGHYYSLNEAMKFMHPHRQLFFDLSATDPSTLTAPQQRMLRLYEAVSTYNQLIQSLSPVLPLAGNQGKTWLDIRDNKQAVSQETQERINLITQGGKENFLFRFLPANEENKPMQALWEAIEKGDEQDEKTKHVIQLLKDMAAAWVALDFRSWSAGAYAVHTTLSADAPSTWRIENIYVALQPMLWVIGLYVLGAGLFVLKMPGGSFAVMLGFLIHMAALIARSLILFRPPTGTLYETLLFAAAVIILVSQFWKDYKPFVIGSALCAAGLLCVSRYFIQGDSLNVLVAVLNTNFWLSTHVTCIIIGYAFCVLAALSGHIMLIKPDVVKNMVLPLTIAALFFTAVGTLLGGIWADQSWGRFWGWDPKENGALLIVLWLSWILHGRLSGHFKPRLFAAVLSLTNIMVALTWFGVNLLGVGLHSYGFISGIAYGLGAFCLGQIVLVFGLYWYAEKQKHVA